ncbi:DEAD/DEAH box helicase family protein, partial [Candidatus Uhrbacteria bacterium]|nr:DEAD/DEAH box helicase family protein [Candidatus Uhrbacteria bacterium]
MVSNDELLLTPYPYQQEAVNCLLENETVSDRSLLVMASGLGKTLTLAFYLKEKLKENSRLRVLFLCHNNDILEQCRDEFARVLDPDITYGLFHGTEKEFKEVTILFASLQTMRDWKDGFFQSEFDLII